MTKTNKLCDFFLAILRHCQDFLTKTAKISQYSLCLHSSFTQLWDTIFYLFEVLVLANEITM